VQKGLNPGQGLNPGRNPDREKDQVLLKDPLENQSLLNVVKN
jgi:hypothetical protein